MTLAEKIGQMTQVENPSISGRLLVITEHLLQWDAFVAAWLSGTEGQGVAEVLFGDHPFAGKLSFTWPRSMDQIPLSALVCEGGKPLFPFGYGPP